MVEAKAALIRAGEHLFARNGIQQTLIRDLNELAGQRNASALHYHFGSREGLVRAIYERHSGEIDAARGDRLAGLGPRAPLHEIVEVILGPMADHLDHTEGRDYLRILAQHLTGEVEPPAVVRAFTLAREHLASLPEPIRDARLLGMLLAAVTLLAERARTIEDGGLLELDPDGFSDNLIDMATGMLTAAITVRAGSSGSPAEGTHGPRSKLG